MAGMQSGAYSQGLPSDAVMMVANASWVQNAVEAALRQVVHPLGRFDILRDVQVCSMPSVPVAPLLSKQATTLVTKCCSSALNLSYLLVHCTWTLCCSVAQA